MDFKDLASRLGIDEDDAKELVELFVMTTVSDIEKIRKGVLEDNPADAAAASHSIKGASGNMGFDDIFALSREMELQARQGSLDKFETYVSDLENKVNALR